MTKPTWLPAYVDPAVLEPGATVYAVIANERTPLTVIRVEPALVCRTPDGEEIIVFAHAVEIADD